MLQAIGNHLRQSTLFVLVVWLVTLALRRSPARARHAVWLAASAKFLVPFSISISLGAHVEWRKAPPQPASAGFAAILDQASAPFSVPAAAVPVSVPSPRRMDPWPAIAMAVWACGFAGIAVSWLVRWRRVRTAVRAAKEFDLGLPIRTIQSPGLLEPGVFGIWHPVLMLPEGILDRLSRPELDTVIAHELYHVRHRDNLFAAIQMAIETIFWFHPVVWWVGKRLLAERERACDEAVVASGSERDVYAKAILNVCKLYVESPLVCAAGVTGAELKERIHAILAGCDAGNLSAVKRMALIAAAAVAMVGPVAIGVMQAPAVRAQTPVAQGPVPKWEAVSIKPCAPNADGGRKGPGGGGPTRGRLSVNCSTVMRLIDGAYGFYANGRGNNWNHARFEGAPAWLDSERYTIEAKSESAQGQAMMRGPMMQSLLEERFKLKMRRDIREVPMYHLTLAKGGPKNLPASKEGSCIPFDFDHLPMPEPGKPEMVLCGMYGRRRIAEGEREFRDPGVTMEDFAQALSAMLDRKVIDQTGLSGKFDIKVQVSVPEPPPPDPDAPRRGGDETDMVFAVVQKLGLKLESAKGPGEVFVIEHVERPSNDIEVPEKK